MTGSVAKAGWRRVLSPRYFLVLGLWVIGLLIAGLVLTIIDTRVVDVPVYVCPPDCGGPPTGLPVSTNPRFVAPDGAFSVAYPAAGPAYSVATEGNGVTVDVKVGDGGTLRMFGAPANGRQAREVVEQYLAEAFPDSMLAYEIPNATAGYHPGYGVVADFVSQKRAAPQRVIVIASVKDDLALVAVGEGPFRQFAAGVGPGPPSPANLQVAQVMGRYLDSFSWRGDAPR